MVEGCSHTIVIPAKAGIQPRRDFSVPLLA
jgi:hypothetical protein